MWLKSKVLTTVVNSDAWVNTDLPQVCTNWDCNDIEGHEAFCRNCTALLADLKESKKANKHVYSYRSFLLKPLQKKFFQSRSCETDAHFIKYEFLYECPIPLPGYDQPLTLRCTVLDFVVTLTVS